MGERLTYVWLAAILILAVACGAGNVNEAPGEIALPETSPAILPGAPEIVRVTPGDGYATVDWLAPSPSEAPASAAEGVVSRYVITGTPDGSRSVPGDVLTARVGGLSNGKDYSFTVRAVNETGFGPESGPSNPILVAAPPGPPPALAATGLSGGGVRLAWLAPSRDGGSAITTYLVAYEPDGDSEEVALVLEGAPAAGYASVGNGSLQTRPGRGDGSSLVFVIDLRDADPGDRFRVSAGNARGTGQWSGWATPATPPPPEPEEAAGGSSDADAQEAVSAQPTDTESPLVSDVSTPGPAATPSPVPAQQLVTMFGSPTPAPAPEPAATPPPGAVPGAEITVRWLPTLYDEGGPPAGWKPSLLGNAGTPFLLHSIEAWSSDPVDVFRGDISWGDGTTGQAWFEDPDYISSRTADGPARLFAYHTYQEPGLYPVTITVSAINHSGVSGQTAIEALIGQ